MGHQRLILKPLAQRPIASASGIGIIGDAKVKRNSVFFHRAVLGTKYKGAALQANKDPLALTSRSLTTAPEVEPP